VSDPTVREMLAATGTPHVPPGSCDPDELAIMVAAMLRDQGVEPSIRARFNAAGEMIAIEVWRGGAPSAQVGQGEVIQPETFGGVRVAAFDCAPMKVGAAYVGMLDMVARQR